MLATSIIIFREVLEVSIILGVLLAATRGLAYRGVLVWTGLGVGIAGAGILAYFAESISQAMEGMGQEVFNALILFLAAILIGWTTIWMKKHGRELTQRLKHVGLSLIHGEKPLYTLAIVIALAVLREGSEMVLFTYGVIASGESITSALLGCFIGLVLGSAVGMAIYYGLLRVSTKYLFSVTSWLLAFVAAGMAAQATNFLVQAGYLPELISPVWDTSSLLSESSIVGKILHTLLGYSERPSGIQLIIYIITLGVIIMISKKVEKTMQNNKPISSHSNSKKVISILIFLGIFISFQSQSIFAFQKVYSPIVVKGEVELEAQGNYVFDNSSDGDGVQDQQYAIGYGITDRWFTEVYGIVEKAEDGDYDFSAIEFENRFQLFEQGQYWIDAGLYLAYELSLEDEGSDGIEPKILLEKSFGKLTNDLNIIFEKKLDSEENNNFESGLAWSTRYRWHEYFEPGFEIHSEFGEIGHSGSFDDQEHLIGPVINGKLFKHVKYNVGYLFGASDSAPDGVLKWVLEYEIYF